MRAPRQRARLAALALLVLLAMARVADAADASSITAFAPMPAGTRFTAEVTGANPGDLVALSRTTCNSNAGGDAELSTFGSVTGHGHGWTTASTLVDLDNDGRYDTVQTRPSGQYKTMKITTTQGCSFSQSWYKHGYAPMSVVGDMDGDGDNDVFVIYKWGNSYRIIKNNWVENGGSCGFSQSHTGSYSGGTAPWSKWVDVTEDGVPDLLLGKAAVTIVQGTPGAAYTPTTVSHPGTFVSFEDLTGDGNAVDFISHDAAAGHVYYNTRTGPATWTSSLVVTGVESGLTRMSQGSTMAIPFPLERIPASSSLGDVDGDGEADVWFMKAAPDTTTPVEMVVYRVVNGAGQLPPIRAQLDPTPVGDGVDTINAPGTTIAQINSFSLGDWNGDGIADVSGVNSAELRVRVWQTPGTGLVPGATAVENELAHVVSTYSPGFSSGNAISRWQHMGHVIADSNGDGLADLITRKWESGIVFFVRSGRLPATSVVDPAAVSFALDAITRTDAISFDLCYSDDGGATWHEQTGVGQVTLQACTAEGDVCTGGTACSGTVGSGTCDAIAGFSTVLPYGECDDAHFGANCENACTITCNAHGVCNSGRFGSDTCVCEPAWSGAADCSVALCDFDNACDAGEGGVGACADDCDGVCDTSAGDAFSSADCQCDGDGVCASGESADGSCSTDCDGVCHTADDGDSLDCDGVCDLTDDVTSPDCAPVCNGNGVCDAGESDQGACVADCDGTCDGSDHTTSPDCACVERMPVAYSEDAITGFTSSDIRATVMADMDGDGDMDLAVTTSAEVAWVENVDNTFGAFVVHNLATGYTLPNWGVNAGDLTGDGDAKLDVVAIVDRYALSVFLNDGSMGFTEVSLSNFGAEYIIVNKPLIVDVDGDGDNDILSATASSSGGQSLAWYKNDGAGAFTLTTVGLSVFTASNHRVRELFFVDWDGDGLEDVLFTGWNKATVSWIRNQGGPDHFADNSDVQLLATQGRRAALADVDDDGDYDLVTTASNDAVHVLLNDGSGALTATTLSTSMGAASGVVIMDANGDLALDVYVLDANSATGGLKLLVGDGQGDFTLTNAVEYSTSATFEESLVMGDLTGVGRQMLVGGTNAIKVFRPDVPNCDGLCDGNDSFPSLDCDGRCLLAIEASTADCDGVCNVGDAPSPMPDCDGVRDAGDELGSPDWLCSLNEHCAGYCNGAACAPNAAGTGECTVSSGANPCVAIAFCNTANGECEDAPTCTEGGTECDAYPDLYCDGSQCVRDHAPSGCDGTDDCDAEHVCSAAGVCVSAATQACAGESNNALCAAAFPHDAVYCDGAQCQSGAVECGAAAGDACAADYSCLDATGECVDPSNTPCNLLNGYWQEGECGVFRDAAYCGGSVCRKDVGPAGCLVAGGQVCDTNYWCHAAGGCYSAMQPSGGGGGWGHVSPSRLLIDHEHHVDLVGLAPGFTGGAARVAFVAAGADCTVPGNHAAAGAYPVRDSALDVAFAASGTYDTCYSRDGAAWAKQPYVQVTVVEGNDLVDGNSLRGVLSGRAAPITLTNAYADEHTRIALVPSLGGDCANAEHRVGGTTYGHAPTLLPPIDVDVTTTFALCYSEDAGNTYERQIEPNLDVRVSPPGGARVIIHDEAYDADAFRAALAGLLTDIRQWEHEIRIVRTITNGDRYRLTLHLPDFAADELVGLINTADQRLVDIGVIAGLEDDDDDPVQVDHNTPVTTQWNGSRPRRISVGGRIKGQVEFAATGGEGVDALNVEVSSLSEEQFKQGNAQNPRREETGQGFGVTGTFLGLTYRVDVNRQSDGRRLRMLQRAQRHRFNAGGGRSGVKLMYYDSDVNIWRPAVDTCVTNPITAAYEQYNSITGDYEVDVCHNTQFALFENQVTAEGAGDPHFEGFHGGWYDFMGEAGKVFNIFSDASFAVNARFVAFDFAPGATYMGEIGVLAGPHRLRFDAQGVARIPDASVCVPLDAANPRKCALVGGGYVSWTDDSMSVAYGAYRVTVRMEGWQFEGGVADALAYELSIDDRALPADWAPHGVHGQTAGVQRVVVGAGKQGEGVVQGVWTDYEVAGGELFGTEWAFNRFAESGEEEEVVETASEEAFAAATRVARAQ